MGLAMEWWWSWSLCCHGKKSLVHFSGKQSWRTGMFTFHSFCCWIALHTAWYFQIVSQGNICSFCDLRVTAVLLDEVMKDPERPKKEHLILNFETKSLRDMRRLLNQNIYFRESIRLFNDHVSGLKKHFWTMDPSSRTQWILQWQMIITACGDCCQNLHWGNKNI